MAGRRARQSLKALLKKLTGKTEQASPMATPPPRHPAVQQVFGVTELLEHILAHLSVTRLAVARRVCRDWNETILTTKSLRQISFLEQRENSEYNNNPEDSVLASMHPAVAAFFLARSVSYPGPDHREILRFQAEGLAEWLERHPYLEQVLIPTMPLRSFRHTVPTYGEWIPFTDDGPVLIASQLCDLFARLDSQVRSDIWSGQYSDLWMTVQMEGSALDGDIVEAAQAGRPNSSWYQFNDSYDTLAPDGSPAASGVAEADMLVRGAWNSLSSRERDVIRGSRTCESGRVKEIFEVHARLAAVKAQQKIEEELMLLSPEEKLRRRAKLLNRLRQLCN